MKNLLLFLFFSLSLLLKVSLANDTIKVMHYNLLYYDKNTSWCTSTNNNVIDKNYYLKEITQHYKPDIFTVNEMNGSTVSVDKLLNNALNTDGISHYKRASYTGSYLVNMLYFNSNKLELKSQSYILTSPRITDVYKLYYKSDDLAKGDTTFITCIVTHLKAGSSLSDINDRALAALQIMSYINNRELEGNIMFMGDFNVYTANETAFQRFTTATSTGFQFLDPVNALGDWQNNIEFSSKHTQSTHISGDCHSGGGMDDRFDFILSGKAILEGTRGLKYINDSYWAFGQDGDRFNQSLLSPSNNSLPDNIISALYNMSDHLPVVLKLNINPELYTGINNEAIKTSKIRVSNPVINSINLWSDGQIPEIVTLQVINIMGSIVIQKELTLVPGEKVSVDASSLNAGIYLIRTTGINHKFLTRIVKQ
jgi:hypothetical protein